MLLVPILCKEIKSCSDEESRYFQYQIIGSVFDLPRVCIQQVTTSNGDQCQAKSKIDFLISLLFSTVIAAESLVELESDCDEKIVRLYRMLLLLCQEFVVSRNDYKDRDSLSNESSLEKVLEPIVRSTCSRFIGRCVNSSINLLQNQNWHVITNILHEELGESECITLFQLLCKSINDDLSKNSIQSHFAIALLVKMALIMS